MSAKPLFPEGTVLCPLAELAPGDLVKVGGRFKRVHRVIAGTDVKTTDGRYYGEHSLQGCYKREMLDEAQKDE